MTQNQFTNYHYRHSELMVWHTQHPPDDTVHVEIRWRSICDDVVVDENGFNEQVDYDEYGTYMLSADMLTEALETSDGWSVHINDDRFMSVFGKCIKYVHELQNAYYISTKKELEVKL